LRGQEHRLNESLGLAVGFGSIGSSAAEFGIITEREQSAARIDELRRKVIEHEREERALRQKLAGEES
jgi:hypothetical protein